MRRALSVGACAAGLVGCGAPVRPPPGGVVLEFGKHALRAEVAASPAGRERGLMGRRRLDTDSGMIFLFPPGKPTGAFWMKNTLIPLSIAFLVRTGADRYRVISVLDMQPCTSDPCRLYDPGAPYDAAVETELGWLGAARVRPGTVVRVVGRAPTPA